MDPNPKPSSQLVSDQTSDAVRRTKRTVFSIKSIMVITAVFAASAVSLGHLVRAAQGDRSEIGHFAVLNAMLPMLVLVLASWFFRIFGRFIK